MSYFHAWAPLSARIKALSEAGHLHARLLGINSADSYARWRALRLQCADTLTALKTFRDAHQIGLPAAAVACIDKFVSDRSSLVVGDADPNMGPEMTTAALVFLSALEAELSFLLADTQEVIRSQSERSFVHLQRSIVADPDIRAKWQRAFDEGETACEQLGSVHLLAHGIFAFKVSGTGERTDLVFNDTIQGRDSVQGFADGLVLTEWKVAKPDATAPSQFQQALTQARRYSQGVLGGLELTGYRYLVVVTEDHVAQLPQDTIEGSVTYRHVNIAVRPSTPSRAR